MYVDTNIAIIDNPLDLANKYLTKYDFTMPKHFARDCVYEEAKECIILGKSKFEETKKQIEEYKKEGYPRNFGLGENGILLRKHNNKKIIKLMKDWWIELNSKTKRDQLSLGYVLWKNDCEFIYMDESARDSRGYFNYILHNEYKDRKLIIKIKDKIKITVKRIYLQYRFRREINANH